MSADHDEQAGNTATEPPRTRPRSSREKIVAAVFVALVGPCFLVVAAVDARLPSDNPGCFESCALNYDRFLLAVETLSGTLGYMGFAFAFLYTGILARPHLGRVTRWFPVTVGSVAATVSGIAAGENIVWWLDGSIHLSTTHAFFRGLGLLLLHGILLLTALVFALTLLLGHPATTRFSIGPAAVIGVMIAVYVTAFETNPPAARWAAIAIAHVAAWAAWGWLIWLGPKAGANPNRP